jgi:hypothetical protein
MYDLVIRLRSNQPFIAPGDWYTIDGLPGSFLCRGEPTPLICGFRTGTHSCASAYGHTTPHQMVLQLRDSA